jgi:flavorubredoxin
MSSLECKEGRSKLIAAQRAAQHLRRKARIVLHYKDSIHELKELYKELKDCNAVLRGARTSYQESLPSTVAKALEYARGWAEGRETLLREQAEREINGKPRTD